MNLHGPHRRVAPPSPDGTPAAARWFYVAAGSLSLALGVVGLVAPLIPTTPLLLLAAWCYARGSRRLHSWLVSHPRLGPILERWWRDRTVPRRAKYGGILLVWITVGLSAAFATDLLVVRVVLVAVAVSVTAFLLTLRTWAPTPVLPPLHPEG